MQFRRKGSEEAELSGDPAKHCEVAPVLAGAGQGSQLSHTLLDRSHTMGLLMSDRMVR